MRRLVLVISLGIPHLAACHRSPTPIDATPAASCPPRGTWTLTARSPCAARPTPLVFTVSPGPAAGPAPMFDVPGTVVASGRTTANIGRGSRQTLLQITDAHVTARGCELAMHFEYVGPHEALRYEARGVIADHRVTAAGTYTYLADDCEPNASDPDGARCTCEDTLALDGST